MHYRHFREVQNVGGGADGSVKYVNLEILFINIIKKKERLSLLISGKYHPLFDLELPALPPN